MAAGRSSHHATGPNRADPQKTGVRERIVDAAIGILRDSGLKRLTQVAVAERAGVRQSHLTYYFPARDDLLAAVMAEAVGAMACAVGEAVEGRETDPGEWVERLAVSVSARGHMRMFVGMIVEADVDESVRGLMVDATKLMEEAVAEVIGGDAAEEVARRLLAAVWGIGLYRFVMRPDGAPDVSWLAEACLSGRELSRRGRRGRRT